MTPSRLAQSFYTASESFSAQDQLDELQSRWLSLSSQQVDAALKEVSSHWTLAHANAFRWAWVAVGVFAWNVAFFVYGMTSATSVLAVLGAHFFTSCFTAVLSLILGQAVLAILRGNREGFEQLLKPARSAPFLCEGALEAVKDSPRARAYRDQLTASGRDLRVLDLYHLKAEARRERLARQEQEQDHTCKMLHGLVPLADAQA